MKIGKIFLFFTIYTSLSTFYFNAMERPISDEQNITVIEKGLLTEVPGVIATTECDWLCNRKITSIYLMRATLSDLIRYEQKSPEFKGSGPAVLFCPIVFKEKENVVTNLGQFNKKKHHELIEAIRLNQALYYGYGQGALIYSTAARPIPQICLCLNKEIDEAGNKQIILSQL